MSTNWRKIARFIRLGRPFNLLGGALLYGLGVAIAVHLDHAVDLSLLLFGIGIAASIQLAAHYSIEHYSASPEISEAPSDTYEANGNAAPGFEFGERTLLYAAAASLTLAATFATVLLVGGNVPLLAWLILLLGAGGAYAYSVPPFRLNESGIGELIASVLLAGIVPGFAFAIQTGDLHPYLVMSTIPLMALYYALLIALQLKTYASDLARGRRRISVLIGWSTAMRLHNLAILLAGLSLGIALVFNLPPRVALGPLIAAPLAVAQVWHLSRVRRGYPPRWQPFTLLSASLFGLTAYLELAGFLLS